MRWDDATLEEADRRHQQGESWAEIAATHGVGRYAVRNAVRRWRKRQEREVPNIDEGDLLFPDLPDLPADSWDTDLLDALVAYQRKLGGLDTGQGEATIIANADKPIGLVFTGDWHLGSRATDHSLMRSDFALMRDTEGLYAVLTGDYGDFFLPSGTPKAQDAQMADAEVQAELVARTIDRYFAGKTAAVIMGNHDWWIQRNAGHSLIMRIAQEQRVPYLRHGGIVNLHLGQAEYRIAARHDFPGRSRINTTNNQRRLFEAVGGADIVSLAHLHFAEIQVQRRAGRDTVWLRNGTYKRGYDDYAARWGFDSGDPRMPMVILWPHEKKMMPFIDFKDGIGYLQSLRREAA